MRAGQTPLHAKDLLTATRNTASAIGQGTGNGTLPQVGHIVDLHLRIRATGCPDASRTRTSRSDDAQTLTLSSSSQIHLPLQDHL